MLNRHPLQLEMKLHFAFIALVSVYDAWLVILHAHDIMDHEQNAIGLYLIRLGSGDVTLFVVCKLLTTTLVMLALTWLARNYRTLMVPVVRSLTIFQTWLLWYLTFAVPESPSILIASHLATSMITAVCLLPFIPDEGRSHALSRLTLAFSRRQERRSARQLPSTVNS